MKRRKSVGPLKNGQGDAAEVIESEKIEEREGSRSRLAKKNRALSILPPARVLLTFSSSRESIVSGSTLVSFTH